MQTLILSKEDFKEPEHWIAMCDLLEVPGEVESVSLNIVSVSYIEPH